MLNYSIHGQLLSGEIGGTKLHMRAYSGGGRGSLHPKTWETSSASWNPDRKMSGGVRGGPVPPGHYVCRHIQHHHRFHECIYLEPTLTALLKPTPKGPLPFSLYNRDFDPVKGFFIHGRGDEGSNGCIVPHDPHQRILLNKAIK
jgi:hypothetical protein